MKDVLITGSTGFIGINLVEYLEAIDFLITTVDRKVRLSNNKTQAIDYDTLSKNRLNVSHYIHLAGKAHDLKNTSGIDEYYEVNYKLTKYIYNSFLEDKRAKTFIFMSSVKAVADKVDLELNEDFEPIPTTPYGRSKLEAEQYILNNLPDDKVVVILRPCMVHGPGNKGNLNLLFNIVKKGFPWPLGSYTNSRNFLSIENLCFVISEILRVKLVSGIYNVSDDKALSTIDLVTIIAEVSNIKPMIWNIPKSMIEILAKVGNTAPFPLNEERLEKLTENYLVSNNKIKEALGIQKMPISAKEGIKSTFIDFESK